MIELNPDTLNLVRGILTLLLMLSFITLTVWVYARKHRNAYDDAAQMPLETDNPVAAETTQRAVTGNAGQSS